MIAYFLMCKQHCSPAHSKMRKRNSYNKTGVSTVFPKLKTTEVSISMKLQVHAQLNKRNAIYP